MNKHGWTYKKLGDVTTSINGLWTGKKPPLVEVAVIRNTNFTKDCNLDMSDVAYLQVEEKQYKTRKLVPGDIIIEKSGGSEKQPVGRPVLFDIPDGEYSFSNFTATLRLTTDNLCPSFLQKFLYAKYCQGFTLKLQPKTTGIHNLDFKSYLKLQTPIPSVSEQEAIVAELDGINGVIAELQKQITDLDQLEQSTFYALFGDPVVNEKDWNVELLGSLANFKNGLNFDKSESDKKIRFLGVSDFQNNYFINTDDLDNITIDMEVSEDFLLKTNDIVFVRSNGSKKLIGRSVIINSQKPATFSGFCIRCRIFDDRLLPLFLLYIAKNKNIIEYLTNSGRGCNISNINQKILSSTPIILPPLALQQEFAAKIEAIETAKAELNAQIAELQTLLASRMDYYFD